MKLERRVVVTGMGLVSTLGCDLETASRALRDSVSGVVVDPERQKLGFTSPLTGRLEGWDGGKGFNRKARRTMGEPALYGASATQSAVADAGLDPERLRSDDVGVVIGNDSTMAVGTFVADRVREAGYTSALGTGTIFQGMNSTVTMNVSTLFGTRGANWTMSAACASGAHAIGQAMMLIGSGAQEIVLTGGAQELSWQSMAPFDALGAFSRRVDDAARASRPFDAERDGLVPSGGAAALVLESLEHARARGARIHGELLAYAFSSNGDHLTNPTVDGPARCMRRALEDAGLAPGEIDYINAHATSTPRGDRQEGRAILEVFGPGGPPVSSTKALTGHECWMAGASEVVYSLLMMRDGFLAANAHLEALDPELEGLNVIRATREATLERVLSNSFGFGGTNAALILAAPPKGGAR